MFKIEGINYNPISPRHDDSKIAFELALLAFNIKREVCDVKEFSFSFLKNIFKKEMVKEV